jgi:hypothetical protein
MSKADKLMAPVHPGEILREDFMKPMGLSVNKLALELHVPADRGNRARAAENYGGDGIGAGAVFQDERGILAEPAELL